MKGDHPSSTACLITRSLVSQLYEPTLRSLLPERAAEISRLFVARRAPLFLRALKRASFRALLRRVEHMALPGIRLHYLLRKRYLEEIARASLAGGVRQVVVLGAGFDTLALRLAPLFPRVMFFELDHPATQQVKTQIAAENRLLSQNIVLLPVDFTRQSLAATLSSCRSYLPELSTLFIAEGLLMYLDPDVVDGVFTSIRGEGALFAFTHLEPEADGRLRFRQSGAAIDWWLRLKGESFRWGLKAEDRAAYLAARGFQLEDLATSETLRQRFLTTNSLASLPLPSGESLCLARKRN